MLFGAILALTTALRFTRPWRETKRDEWIKLNFTESFTIKLPGGVLQ